MGDRPDVASSRLDATADAEHRAWLRRAVQRTDPTWSLERSIGAVDRLVTAVAGHVGDGMGGLAELHALAELRSRLGDTIDTVARHLLEADDYSYREIGEALGITKQAAELRYRGSSSRPAGGQPGNLR